MAAKATPSGMLTAFIVGTTGAVLLISGIYGSRPGATMAWLLQTGTLPPKGLGYSTTLADALKARKTLKKGPPTPSTAVASPFPGTGFTPGATVKP